MKLLYVEWIDSVSGAPSVWNNREGVANLKPDTIQSVGWLLKETEDAVTLVAHLSADEVSGDMVIPKCAIKKRRVIKSP